MQEKRNGLFGAFAQKVLLIGLPFLVLSAFALVICLSTMDSIHLMKHSETIRLYLETISRAMVCLTIGTVLADIAERKTKRNS